jgi:hypothetical protein
LEPPTNSKPVLGAGRLQRRIHGSVRGKIHFAATTPPGRGPGRAPWHTCSSRKCCQCASHRVYLRRRRARDSSGLFHHVHPACLGRGWARYHSSLAPAAVCSVAGSSVRKSMSTVASIHASPCPVCRGVPRPVLPRPSPTLASTRTGVPVTRVPSMRVRGDPRGCERRLARGLVLFS